MKTIEIKVSDLKPHPKNEEIYGYGEDISDLVKKIKKSGRVHTMTINSKGVILAGHRRYRTCLELGIETVNAEVVDFDTLEEEIEFIVLDNHQRNKTNEQKAKEAKALKEVESKLAKRRQGERNDIVPNSAQSLNENGYGRSRDKVAKNVGLRSGHEVDRAINAINKIDTLKDEGRIEDAELIRGVLNNGSISAADELARNIDIVEIPEKDKSLIKSGKKSSYSYVEKAKQKQKPKKDKCKNCCSKNSKEKETEYIGNTSITMKDLEETVQEYNAQSRGEIEIVIPEREKGYVSKTLESAMSEFRRKVAQCMIHQKEIAKLEEEEKIRLNRLMTKFIEDFEKDKNYITGGI